MYTKILTAQWTGSMYFVYALLIFFAGIALGAIIWAVFRKKPKPENDPMMDYAQEHKATMYTVGCQVLRFLGEVCDELGLEYQKSNVYMLFYFHYRNQHYSTMLPTQFMIANPDMADAIIDSPHPLSAAFDAMIQYGDISDRSYQRLSEDLKRRMVIFSPWGKYKGYESRAAYIRPRLTPMVEMDTENDSGH